VGVPQGSSFLVEACSHQGILVLPWAHTYTCIRASLYGRDASPFLISGCSMLCRVASLENNFAMSWVSGIRFFC
jgi:hypothetical protein